MGGGAISQVEHLREPVRGGAAYPGLAALPGIEQVRAFLTGRAPAPPVARLTGRRIVDASYGSATYDLRASDWLAGPKGVVHPGVLALLADGALIASVVSALPPRVLCTTAELSMTFLGSPPSAGGEITAHGRLLHLDEEMALAEVEVRDARDRLVAHGTGGGGRGGGGGPRRAARAGGAGPPPPPRSPADGRGDRVAPAGRICRRWHGARRPGSPSSCGADGGSRAARGPRRRRHAPR